MENKRTIDEVVESFRSHGLVLGRKTAQLQKVYQEAKQPEVPEGRGEDNQYYCSYMLGDQSLHGERFSAVVVETYWDPGRRMSDSNYHWGIYLVDRQTEAVEELIHERLDELSGPRPRQTWGLIERLQESHDVVRLTLLPSNYDGRVDLYPSPEDKEFFKEKGWLNELGVMPRTLPREARLEWEQWKEKTKGGRPLERKILTYSFSLEPILKQERIGLKNRDTR